MTATTEPQRRNRRAKFDDDTIAGIKRKAKRRTIVDPLSNNLFLRIPAIGSNAAVSFTAVVRNSLGKQLWVKLGHHPGMTVAQARDRAAAVVQRVRQNLPPVEPPPVAPDSVADTCAAWVKRYVKPRKMRTEASIVRNISKHILPAIGGRPFKSLRRSDIAALADKIEDDSGARQADVVMQILRSVSNWVASRDDDFVPVFVKGMKRDVAGPRSRTLDDDEIRKIWIAAQGEGVFGALVMLLLLLGQRRSITVNMRHEHISDGVWSIPHESDRAKGNVQQVRLPQLALDIIAAQPRLNDYVLPAMHGDGPAHNFTRGKARLDRKSGVSGWVLHDCRRVFRSIASRVGTDRDHNERTLGHRPKGVDARVYDQHHYFEEKSMVVAKVADEISAIVNGEPGGKVVRMKKRAK
jgi:integrase